MDIVKLGIRERKRAYALIRCAFFRWGYLSASLHELKLADRESAY